MEFGKMFNGLLTAILTALCIWLGKTTVELSTSVAVLQTKLENTTVIVSILGTRLEKTIDSVNALTVSMNRLSEKIENKGN